MIAIYLLEISCSRCNYELWLNGIRVDYQMRDSPVVYDLTLNRWLKKSGNVLRVIMKPLRGSDELHDLSYFRANLAWGTPVNGIVRSRELVKAVKSPDFRDIREKNKGMVLAKYELTEGFDTKIEYQNGIFTGLPRLQAGYPEIQQLYEKAHQLFKNRKTQELIEWMGYKISEYAMVFDKSIEEEKKRQSGILEDLYRNELITIDFPYYKPVFYQNNTIVCMEDDEGTQPIVYDGGGTDFIFYDLFFSKDDKGEWIIAL